MAPLGRWLLLAALAPLDSSPAADVAGQAAPASDPNGGLDRDSAHQPRVGAHYALATAAPLAWVLSVLIAVWTRSPGPACTPGAVLLWPLRLVECLPVHVGVVAKCSPRAQRLTGAPPGTVWSFSISALFVSYCGGALRTIAVPPPALCRRHRARMPPISQILADAPPPAIRALNRFALRLPTASPAADTVHTVAVIVERRGTAGAAELGFEVATS
jgi:hypothetical protein